MPKIRLTKLKTIRGQIKVISGLHIGQGNNSIEIGGVDMPVIKDTRTQEPYIPGSSLKGKMRSLLEWKLGEIGSDGKIKEASQDDTVARIFGHTNKELKLGPTRIIVRDCKLKKDSTTLLGELTSPIEVKSENYINRITAEANPRQLERVIPEVKFDMEIIYRIFAIDDDEKTDEECFLLVLEGLKLLELDALGGGGSRGNGKIRFEDLKVFTLDFKNLQKNPEENINLEEISFSSYKVQL